MSDSSSPRPSRRSFLSVSAAAAVGLGARVFAAAEHPQRGATRATAAGDRGRFFTDPSFEFIFQASLGQAYYRCGNVGKLLAIASEIEDGDSESAYHAFRMAGDEARDLAESAARRAHRVSAREGYLWAASYTFASTYFLDGTKDPSRFLSTWKLYNECWDRAAALFDPPVERVQIPYENKTLSGYFFRVDSSKKRRPLLILNNGADASEQSTWIQGGAAGVARGYNCLTFDGPGQGAALWLQELYFRPDWEKVITPVVDFALRRPEVDPKRIALQGISQGGYWVPRAVAFEHRIAAAIADPGVWNVSLAWTQQLPNPVLDLLHADLKEEFDRYFAEGVLRIPRMKALLAFRMRPYGFDSYHDVYKAVLQYDLKSVADQIRCPMLITNPQFEPFFPGQSKQLYDMLQCKKTLVDFTAEQGAGLHCEVNAPGYRDLRVFDWLDETLGHSAG